jgi:hypothetical protein
LVTKNGHEVECAGAIRLATAAGFGVQFTQRFMLLGIKSVMFVYGLQGNPRAAHDTLTQAVQRDSS